jgi:hypothetical protein
MSILKQNKLLPLIALMFIIGAMFFCGTAKAYAADSPAGEPTPTVTAETPADSLTLIVKEVWLTGDTLHINVAERKTGDEQTLELNLRDYAKPADEYVTIQATDSSGRASNSVSFKNPYYEPTTTPEPIMPIDTSESAAPDGKSPLTPDGTGTVLDNVTDGDGKEFFTVETPDGNVFYLIVDRQRDSDNVYLLNAVNEDDLASLAKPGDGKSVSAIPTPEVTATPEPQTTAEPATESAPEKSNNNGMLIFVGIAVVVIGGAAYYIKIVRPKKSGASEPDYEPEDDFDDDEETDIETGDEDGDDE